MRKFFWKHLFVAFLSVFAVGLVSSCEKSSATPKSEPTLTWMYSLDAEGITLTLGEATEAGTSVSLTLSGVPEKMVRFSDRPYRLTQQRVTDELNSLWSAGNTFNLDHPNTVLRFQSENQNGKTDYINMIIDIATFTYDKYEKTAQMQATIIPWDSTGGLAIWDVDSTDVSLPEQGKNVQLVIDGVDDSYPNLQTIPNNLNYYKNATNYWGDSTDRDQVVVVVWNLTMLPPTKVIPTGAKYNVRCGTCTNCEYPFTCPMEVGVSYNFSHGEEINSNWEWLYNNKQLDPGAASLYMFQSTGSEGDDTRIQFDMTLTTQMAEAACQTVTFSPDGAVNEENVVVPDDQIDSMTVRFNWDGYDYDNDWIDEQKSTCADGCPFNVNFSLFSGACQICENNWEIEQYGDHKAVILHYSTAQEKNSPVAFWTNYFANVFDTMSKSYDLPPYLQYTEEMTAGVLELISSIESNLVGVVVIGVFTNEESYDEYGNYEGNYASQCKTADPNAPKENEWSPAADDPSDNTVPDSGNSSSDGW